MRRTALLFVLTFVFAEARTHAQDAPEENESSDAAEGANAAPDVAQDSTPDAVLPPAVLEAAQAVYPPDAERLGLNAVVGLSIVIDASGEVSDARVLEAQGHGFDEAALSAIRRFRFSPATRGGEPIAVRIRYDYVFELEVPAPPEPVFGEIAGRLLSREGEEPIQNAELILTSEDLSIALRRTSGVDGTFSFAELPAGSYSVRVIAEGFDASDLAESVVAGEHNEVIYRLRPTQSQGEDDVEGFGARAVIDAPAREVTRRTIPREVLTRIPGTRGDALRAVELLPGVGRPAFGSGQLIVRGASPEESQAFVEGAPLALLYHFGGLTGTLSSRLIDQIDFVPGNFSVRYGRKMGGIVEVSLRDPTLDLDARGVHGALELSAIDASGIIEVPIGERAAGAFGFRRSILDLYIGSVLPDDIGVVASPVYYDYQAMVTYRPTPDDRLRFMFHGANDRFAINFDDAAGDEPQVRGAASLVTRSNQLQIGWRHQFNANTRLDLSAMAALWQTDVSLGESFGLQIDVWRTTYRLELRHRVSSAFAFVAGIDADVSPYTVSYLGPVVSQEEGGEMGAVIGDTQVTSQGSETGFQPAAYLELDMRPVSSWQVLLGARVDYNHQTRNAAFDPRLATIVHLTDEVRLKGGVGIFSQPSPFEYATAEVGGNPNLGWQHALHSSIGVEADIADGVRLSLEGFHKYQWDRIVSTPGGQGPGFDNAGIGRIFGVEASARVNPEGRRWFGYLSYTLSRSERRDRPEDDWRLFDFDQTHIFSLAAVYRLPRGWELGATIRLVSGNPTTVPEGAVLNVDDLRYRAIDGPLNNSRSSLFNRIDVRIEKKWTFDAWSLGLYLDVQNVTNRQNEEGRSFNYDFSASEPVRGLPILPAIGIRGEL